MRAPAHSNLHSHQLNWETPDDQAIGWLTHLLTNYPGKKEVAYSGVRGVRPAYVRASNIHEENYQAFIKLIPPSHAEHERLVANLGLSMIARGISTPALREEFLLSDGTVAFVYEWIEGRPPASSPLEMQLLGHAVARLHRALKLEAQNFETARRTSTRLYELAHLATSRRFADRWQGNEDENFVWRMRDAFLSEYDSMLTNPSPCHGDLNPGNLLINDEGVPYFIDLEDALHTEVWPGFDLAKIIERLVLPVTNIKNHNHFVRMAETLVESYTDAGGVLGNNFRLGTGRFARAMRWHLGLAILIITKSENVASSELTREIEKFKTVDRLIETFESFM